MRGDILIKFMFGSGGEAGLEMVYKLFWLPPLQNGGKQF